MANYNVLKAGGTSVGTPSAMEIILNETFSIHDSALSQNSDSVTILVVSATGKQLDGHIRIKTTDLLEKILAGEQVEEYKREIFRREEVIAQHFGLGEGFNRENYRLLDHYLLESGVAEEGRYSKSVTIVGERLKARQFAAIFNKMRDNSAIHVDYDKTGFTTSGKLRHASATPDVQDNIMEALSRPEYRGKIVVLGGFMGIDSETGAITTLERGGSDTHAVYVACAVDANCAYIYSDTSLRRTDPRIVPEAEIVTNVSNREMTEFIGLGSEILAERANKAAEEGLLRLVLRDTFHLNGAETVVSSNTNGSYGEIKGIGACPAVVLSLGGLPNVPGAHNQVTSILRTYGVNFINEAGDTENSSMVLMGSRDRPLETNIGGIMREISQLGLRVQLNYNDLRIGLIGEGIGSQVKALIAVGRTLETAGLPVRMVSYPENGVALSLVTNQLDEHSKIRFMRTLYHNLYGSTH